MAPAPSVGGLSDLLGGVPQPSAGKKTKFEVIKTNININFLAGFPPVTAFEKNGLKIVFSFEKVANNPSNIINVNTEATNALPITMTDFVFQVAVPKVTNAGRIRGRGFLACACVVFSVEYSTALRQCGTPVRLRERFPGHSSGQSTKTTPSDANTDNVFDEWGPSHRTGRSQRFSADFVAVGKTDTGILL